MDTGYELVIFDLDGTLLDTSYGIFNSVRYAEKMMGFKSISDDKLKEFVGPPPKEIYKNAYKVSEEIAQQAVKYHREYGKTKAVYEAKPYSNVKKALQVLRSKGYKLAVATLKTQKIADMVLSHYGMKDYFDVIVGMDAEESLTKYDTIKIVLHELQILPEKAVLVGDSKYDLNGARQARVDFIGALYGFGLKEDDKRFPSINSPIELVDILI